MFYFLIQSFFGGLPGEGSAPRPNTTADWFQHQSWTESTKVAAKDVLPEEFVSEYLVYALSNQELVDLGLSLGRERLKCGGCAKSLIADLGSIESLVFADLMEPCDAARESASDEEWDMLTLTHDTEVVKRWARLLRRQDQILKKLWAVLSISKAYVPREISEQYTAVLEGAYQAMRQNRDAVVRSPTGGLFDNTRAEPVESYYGNVLELCSFIRIVISYRGVIGYRWNAATSASSWLKTIEESIRKTPQAITDLLKDPSETLLPPETDGE